MKGWKSIKVEKKGKEATYPVYCVWGRMVVCLLEDDGWMILWEDAFVDEWMGGLIIYLYGWTV